jgi:hypothetical protein
MPNKRIAIRGGAYRGFVERAEEILAEINQIFLDADHWNCCVRKPGEANIDPDPDGALLSAKRNLEAFITRAT